MRPDRLTGLYSLSGTFRGRSDEDSIKVQAPNIREVFNLAGISAGFMLDNNERNRWFKLISDARIGIDNLMETYENQVWANVSQKDVIDELTTEIDIQVRSMQAFLATREKYSVGYKSSKAVSSSKCNTGLMDCCRRHLRYLKHFVVDLKRGSKPMYLSRPVVQFPCNSI